MEVNGGGAARSGCTYWPQNKGKAQGAEAGWSDETHLPLPSASVSVDPVLRPPS